MPQVSLTSSSVTYNLYTLLVAADPQIQRSVAGLQIQVPDASVVAGNAGAIVKVGRPNSASAPTSITNAELSLLEGESDGYPDTVANNISLAEKYVNGSASPTVLYVQVTQA